MKRNKIGLPICDETNFKEFKDYIYKEHRYKFVFYERYKTNSKDDSFGIFIRKIVLNINEDKGI